MPRCFRTPGNSIDLVLSGDRDFQVLLPQIKGLNNDVRGSAVYNPATKRWRIRYDRIPAFCEATGYTPEQIEQAAPRRTDALDAFLAGKAPVFDIETWVVPEASVHNHADHRVVSISWKYHGEPTVHALAIDHPDEEREMLAAFAEAIKDAPFVFGYNCDDFDWDVLNRSWERLGIGYRFPVMDRSVDLIPFGYAMRDAGMIPNAKLKTLEVYYGIDRADDISGKTVALMVQAMFQEGDPARRQEMRQAILRHNREDVEYLCRMVPQLFNMEPSSVPDVQAVLQARADADRLLTLRDRRAALDAEIAQLEGALRERAAGSRITIRAEEGTLTVEPDGTILFEPSPGLALLTAARETAG